MNTTGRSTGSERCSSAGRASGLVVGLLLLASLFVGCRVHTLSTATSDLETAWQQVHLGDPELRSSLAIGPHAVDFDRHGRLRVDVPVRNQGEKEVRLEAQVVFLGPRGVATNDETARHHITLTERGVHRIRACARTSSATDYRIYLWNAE